ncbi:MAG: ion channel [Caulobacterales bacterium]
MKIFERADHLALFVVQPLVAGLALIGLAVRSEAANEVTQPLFIWGGVAMLALVFAEGVWSFARRHAERRHLGRLWAKLLGAGVCAILAFASAYKHLGLIDNDRVVHDAGAALYFSILSWTTAGSSDVIATLDARPFAAAQTLFGLAYNSALIGIVLFAITGRAKS